jgi:transposase
MIVSTDYTDRAREAFLGILRETCNVSEAARAANISRKTAYNWREKDETFAAGWDDAEQEAADKLEKVAWERATSGQSDRMLEILLKAHRPGKFTERKELSGPGGGVLPVSIEWHIVTATED